MFETKDKSAVLVIGDEVLAGSTKDTNSNWLAIALGKLGLPLGEVRVVPDIPEEIVGALNALRAKYKYVFTTGGIGPTHDDITADCVAAAFGVGIDVHPEARKLLADAYGEDKLTDARLRMARIPHGAALVSNPLTAAPGFHIGNVYVMAGVPSIMQAMFEGIQHELDGGAPIIAGAVFTTLRESIIADRLGEIQNEHPKTSIGSYPQFRTEKPGVKLVVRSTDPAEIVTAIGKIKDMILRLDGDVEDTAV